MDPFSSQRVFVIAEAGSNWRAGTPERDRKMARALIDVAADAGADAVKFQTYRADTVYAPDAGKTDYLSEAGIDESINDVFRDLEMPYDLIPELAAYCVERKIEFMSTPFSPADLRAVDPFVTTHKIASYEISDIRLLEAVAKTRKPVVLSTAVSTPDDIDVALGVLRDNGAGPICLLQCTAGYPAPSESLNLLTIPWLRERYGVPAGLSDHSADPVVAPVAAVALGAVVIEKHYTLDRRLPGPDHAFALTPNELAQLVRAVRLATAMRGTGTKDIDDVEKDLHAFGRRRVQATRAITVGETFEEGVNVAILRPGSHAPGVHPKELASLLGRSATRDIGAGEGVQLGDWTGD
jgi:sialic acid synthase SpsE